MSQLDASIFECSLVATASSARATARSASPKAPPADRLAKVLDRPGVVTRINDAWLRSSSATVYRTGAFEACEAICLVAFTAYGSPIHLFNAARCAARLGDVDRALATLRRAIDAGFSERARLFVDPDLETVSS